MAQWTSSWAGQGNDGSRGNAEVSGHTASGINRGWDADGDQNARENQDKEETTLSISGEQEAIREASEIACGKIMLYCM